METIDKHKRENNKIFRVFKVTLEMLEDRGYTIPPIEEGQTATLKDMTYNQFVKRYQYDELDPDTT